MNVTIQILDNKTGELKDHSVKPIREKHKGGQWVIVNQEWMCYIASKRIRGKTRSVLDMLVGMAGFKNTLPTIKKVSSVLGMKRPSVSRAYKELLDNRILLKDGDDYVINPKMYWKGTQKQCDEMIKRLQEQGVQF